MNEQTPTPILRQASETYIGASPPRWDIFSDRKATVVGGPCVAPGALERFILTDLSDAEIEKAKVNALLHMDLMLGRIDVGRIQLHSNKYIMIDGHEITFKPLHVMVVLNTIDSKDPDRKAFCFALAKKFELIASFSGDAGLWKEACNAVDKYK